MRNFWKVIFERKCAAVVMLTPMSENGQVRDGLHYKSSLLSVCVCVCVCVCVGGMLPVLAREWQCHLLR